MDLYWLRGRAADSTCLEDLISVAERILDRLTAAAFSTRSSRILVLGTCLQDTPRPGCTLLLLLVTWFVTCSGHQVSCFKSQHVFIQVNESVQLVTDHKLKNRKSDSAIVPGPSHRLSHLA